MKTLTNLSVLLSSMTLAAATLAGCAADATPNDQSSSQNSLGGVTPAPTATPCSTYDGAKQKCEAQPMCDYIDAKDVCVAAPGAPTPQPSGDPCTARFGKDQQQCDAVAPKCMFDKNQGLCVLGSGGGGGTVSKCGGYTNPTACMGDPACTFDKNKMACIDAGGTTAVDAVVSAVDAICMKTYGADPVACAADLRCAFDAQRKICRAR